MKTVTDDILVAEIALRSADSMQDLALAPKLYGPFEQNLFLAGLETLAAEARENKAGKWLGAGPAAGVRRLARG